MGAALAAWFSTRALRRQGQRTHSTRGGAWDQTTHFTRTRGSAVGVVRMAECGVRAVHSPLRRGCARTKLLSYGIATVHDGTLERMDVSGAPGVRWEEREKLEDAVTASSRRMRAMLCVPAEKREKREEGAR